MRPVIAIVTVALVLVLLTACGGGSDGPGRVWDESSVVSSLGLTKPEGSANPAEWQYRTPTGMLCPIFGIQTSRKEVDLYKEAGDPIATNPDGSVGLKVNTSQTGEVAACLEALTEAMASLN